MTLKQSVENENGKWLCEKGARNCHANLYASYSNKISQNYDTNHVRIISLLCEGMGTMSTCVSFYNTISSTAHTVLHPLDVGHATETKDES